METPKIIGLVKMVNSSVASKKNSYIALADNKEIYKSVRTNHDYVAIMIKDGNALHRFGRVDLIGKADSKTPWLTHNFDYIAVLESVAHLVSIPPKQELKIWVTKGFYGKDIECMAFDKQEAGRWFAKISYVGRKAWPRPIREITVEESKSYKNKR